MDKGDSNLSLHPLDLPGGATMFFCIGAQKAGTTWLYKYFEQAPEVHFPAAKEVHYFDVRYARGEAEHYANRVRLLQTFAGRISSTPGPKDMANLAQVTRLAELLSIYVDPDGSHRPYIDYLSRGHSGQPVMADFTPSYAALGGIGFSQMARIGNARFLFVMRDPISRLWSQIRMAVRTRQPDAPDYEQACRDHAAGMIARNHVARVARSNYAATVTELMAVVPQDRICLAFYERLFSDEGVGRICDFIGVARRPAPAAEVSGLGRPAPLDEETGRGLMKGLLPQYLFAFERFRDDVPQAWSASFDRYAR